MGTTYAPAPEVAELAVSLIAEHHGNLLGAPIVYVYVDPAPKARGKTVLGRARKVTGLNAFLVALAAGEVEPAPEPIGVVDDEDEPEDDWSFFVMEVAQEEWRQATREQRLALVDHELCHFKVGPEGDLSIRGHDVEEFDAVVRRHGLWREDLQRFAGTCSASSASCAVTT